MTVADRANCTRAPSTLVTVDLDDVLGVRTTLVILLKETMAGRATILAKRKSERSLPVDLDGASRQNQRLLPRFKPKFGRGELGLKL